WSLDHVGIIARGVEDAALALSVLAGPDRDDPLSIAAPVEDYVAATREPAAPRIGVLRALVERAEPEVARHVGQVAQELQRAGARVEDVELPAAFAAIHDAVAIILRVEAAAYHSPMFARHGGEYPVKIGEAVADGARIAGVDFAAAQRERQRFRRQAVDLAARWDALLTPAAFTTPPPGLAATGDPYFCAPWSAAGVPALAP